MTKIVELSDALKVANDRIDQLNRKPESSRVQLAFNNLIEDNSEIRNVAFRNATEEHILAMNRTVMDFEVYVKKSVR